MGRVNINDLDKYNTGGGKNFVKWFSLKDDKDTAQVRIMLDNPEDINKYLFATHKITVGEKAKYPNQHISCLRAYNDPIEDCPFCADKDIPGNSVRFFIPVYNIEEDEVQFFDRPKSYVGKIQGMMGRYKDFASHIFEIERNGAKGDKQTTYEFYEIDDDDVTLDDLPEIPELLGSAIWDKSFDDMEYYLSEGSFPPADDTDDDEDEKPVRRRSDSRKKQQEEDDDEPPFDEDEEEERPRRRERERESRRSKERTVRKHRSNNDEF